MRRYEVRSKYLTGLGQGWMVWNTSTNSQATGWSVHLQEQTSQCHNLNKR